MKMQWKKIWVKAVIWLVTEIILNLSGFDNLADYSEFIFEQEVTIATSQLQMTVVVPFRRPQFDHGLPCRYTIGIINA
jgi:hypothetical protein